MSKSTNPWTNCPCGHPWMRHDVNEYSGDGSETCCVEGCEQAGCPGSGTPPTWQKIAEGLARRLAEVENERDALRGQVERDHATIGALGVELRDLRAKYFPSLTGPAGSAHGAPDWRDE